MFGSAKQRAVHRQVTPVSPEMLHLSVGIEHIDDILTDLEQALESSAK